MPADAGNQLTDIISTRVLIASGEREDLVAAWEVVSGRFGEHDLPSTLIGVSALGYPPGLVEIEAVAQWPDEKHPVFGNARASM